MFLTIYNEVYNQSDFNISFSSYNKLEMKNAF